MTALTVVTIEGDVGAAVHGKTVIVVVHLGTGDGNVRRGANIEGVGVVAKSVLGSTFRKRRKRRRNAPNVRRNLLELIIHRLSTSKKK